MYAFNFQSGRKKYGRNRLNKIQLNVPWAKDRVLSDVDPREGFDPTHLPSAPRHGVAHAQAASCHRPQASGCHPSRAGSTRHAAHHAEASRSSSIAGHWAARDARITAWNAKDASSQIEKSQLMWRMWGCGEPMSRWQIGKVYQFCGDWA